ncbi:MAG: invasion associated locus B family protein [Paracoccaceae bacterium]|nr:invasion associated locus B family protein [Paracoccaceae bacterium]MDE2915376.1 invasion associated locus B family protein [Paracoccaceae bacterium]
MKSRFRLAGATIAFGWLATVAGAQQTLTQPLKAINDWYVHIYESGDVKECFVSSIPKRSVNTRGGKEVQVRRGVTQISVTFRPKEGVTGEVSFTGGYPYDPKSTVKLSVGGTTFDLYVDGEWAWTSGPDADEKIHEAFRRGATATVVGRSSRGTTTRDSISLIGFTAAMTEAKKLCT